MTIVKGKNSLPMPFIKALDFAPAAPKKEVTVAITGNFARGFKVSVSVSTNLPTGARAADTETKNGFILPRERTIAAPIGAIPL